MQRSVFCVSRLATFWTKEGVRHECNGRNAIACRLPARGIYCRGENGASRMLSDAEHDEERLYVRKRFSPRSSTVIPYLPPPSARVLSFQWLQLRHVLLYVAVAVKTWLHCCRWTVGPATHRVWWRSAGSALASNRASNTLFPVLPGCHSSNHT